MLDDQYIEDVYSGARINSDSIRGAMQRVLDTDEGLFHVHCREHRGKPGFSLMDVAETPRIVSSLQVASPSQAHVWLPSSSQPIVADRVSVIGYPVELFD